MVSLCVLFCKLVVLLQIFGSLNLPDFTNFLHNVQRRYVRHLTGNFYSSLSHKEHVGSQRLLWHLIKKSLIVNFAQLSQLLRESFLVSFRGIFVLLSLLLSQFLPLLSDHLNYFSDFNAWILVRNHGSLLVSKQNIR